MHAGSHMREAAFEPLAALLLQSEALRHLDADSHGASHADKGKTCRGSRNLIGSHHDEQPGWMADIAVAAWFCTAFLSAGHMQVSLSPGEKLSCIAERLVKAPHASGVCPRVHMDAPTREDGASMQPSAVQLQLAEHIADAVAARLNARAAQHAQREPSTAQACCDMASAHAAPQDAGLNSQKARQTLPSKHAEAATQVPLQSLKREGSQGRACEEDFLAALLQGSPGRPSRAGQPGRPQACEQDYLAALLLTPGTSKPVSHAASPGLMHKASCSTSDSKAGGASPAADSRAQPWTPQWAGRLTQQQMETALQEVQFPKLEEALPGPKPRHFVDCVPTSALVDYQDHTCQACYSLEQHSPS